MRVRPTPRVVMAAWWLPMTLVASPQHAQAQAGHSRTLSSEDSLAIPPPTTKAGCAAFDLRIVGGSVAVARAPTPTCGPISPVIAGTPLFDSGRRIIHLPVALYNGGEARMHLPASLVAKPESIVLLIDSSPSPAAAPSTSVTHPLPAGGAESVPHFVGTEPQLELASAEPALGQWAFDTVQHPLTSPLVAAADGSMVLPPNATSLARSVDLAVPRSVSALRISLMGFGTYVLAVPLRPSDRVPPDELAISRSPDNVITDDPHFPGHVVRNKLWVLFRSSATLEQREAAIESINGFVVGGSLRGTGNNYPPPSGAHTIRYYYVSFPAYPDSGAAPLERAIGKLASLPQVQDVRPDILGQNWGYAVP